MQKPSCKTKSILIAAALAMAALVTPLSGYAQYGEEVMRSPANVPYVSGGIGLDSIDRMQAKTREFNVKLVFALQSGDYLSDVRVTIIDAAGNPVVDTTSNGPWFLTTLPIGKFRITANHAGNAKERFLAVGTSKLNTLDFRWATE